MHQWNTSQKRSELKKKKKVHGWKRRLQKGLIDQKVKKVKWTKTERILK